MAAISWIKRKTITHKQRLVATKVATNHLSGLGLVQPIKLSSAAERCAGKGCALNKQLAN